MVCGHLLPPLCTGNQEHRLGFGRGQHPKEIVARRQKFLGDVPFGSDQSGRHDQFDGAVPLPASAGRDYLPRIAPTEPVLMHETKLCVCPEPKSSSCDSSAAPPPPL